MIENKKDWNEKRIIELHKKASAMHVRARVNVDYYDAKAERLNKKIRWATAISALSAVAVAGIVPWVSSISLLMYPVAILSLVSPGIMSWTKAKDWSMDLAAYIKTRDMSRALELEIEYLFERIELRDYESPTDLIHQYHRLQQRWEFVGQIAPPEIPNEDEIRELRLKAEKGQGLTRDAKQKRQDDEAPTEALS